MIAIGVAVAGMFLLDVVNTTLIQRIVPDALRGRAMGGIQASSSILYAGGALVMPILADAIGVAPVLIGSAVISVAGVATALVLTAGRGEPEAEVETRARLLGQPIFAGLPSPRLEEAARRMAEVPMAVGDTIVRQGDPSDRFFVIVEGSVRVTQRAAERDDELHLRDLRPGDVFGEIGLLRRSPRTATVTALTDGRLLALDAEAFHELVGSGPGLSTRMLDLYRGAISRS
jgi:MFS family permease